MKCIFASVQAVLSGFPVPRLTDKEAMSIVLTECLTFPIALSVLYLRGWRQEDVGIRITWPNSLLGLLLFGAALLVDLALYKVCGQLIGGADFLMQFQQSIFLSAPIAILASFINGIFEEFFLCRYLVEVFAKFGLQLL
jgi:hypothetical protein